jgi:putative nucleotidyltransferase with HDIG domain
VASVIAPPEKRTKEKPVALRHLPPLPTIAAKLLRMVSEDNFSYKAVADLIRADPAFAVEVLRLANSPMLGLRHEIRDVPHAVAVLGVNRLRGVVLTLAMKDFMLSVRQNGAVKRSWRHSLGTALAAEILAPALFVDVGLAYTGGLLHDVGMLALAAYGSGEYTDLVNGSFPDSIDFLTAEHELLGTDHCEIGRQLLDQWELPEVFQVVAAEHHFAEGGDVCDTTRVVHLACATASMAGFSPCARPNAWEPECVLQALPEKTRERYRPRFESVPLEVATKINAFDCDFLG